MMGIFGLERMGNSFLSEFFLGFIQSFGCPRISRSRYKDSASLLTPSLVDAPSINTLAKSNAMKRSDMVSNIF